MDEEFALPYLWDVRGIVLSGGEDSRIRILTHSRNKAGIPYGANYRIIEFPVRNMWLSGIKKIDILTQRVYQSMEKYVARNYPVIESDLIPFNVEVVGMQQREDKEWSRGSGETLYQNRSRYIDAREKYLAIMPGDQVSFINLADVVRQHKEGHADITLCASLKRKSECKLDNREGEKRVAYGILRAGADNVVTSFEEKPLFDECPENMWVSMHNMVFSKDVLIDLLSNKPKDIATEMIPEAIRRGMKVMLSDYSNNPVPGMKEPREKNKWWDIEGVDTLYDGNMDLVSISPSLNLYNHQWPWRNPPSKNVFAEGINVYGRAGVNLNCIEGDGVINSGAQVESSVLFSSVRIEDRTHVDGSILFEGCIVGKRCNIKNTILDKGVVVPDDTDIGQDKEEDLDRAMYVSPKGITVVRKKYSFEYERGFDETKFQQGEDFENTGEWVPRN